MERTLFGALLCLVLSLPATCAQIDWPAFFHDALSKDRATQDAARDLGLNSIIPHLCGDDASLVVPEIPGLAEELNQENADIRLNASAFLCTVARFRSDSAVVLLAAIPALSAHIDDPVVQIRQNCVNTLALLKPAVPVEVLPTLSRIVQGKDAAVQGGAILGLLRLSHSNSDAKQAVNDMLSKGSPLRRQTIESFLATPVNDNNLLARLGDCLPDGDPGLQRAALVTIGRYGNRVIALNRERIVAFVQESTDRDLVAMAQKLLDELNER